MKPTSLQTVAVALLATALCFLGPASPAAPPTSQSAEPAARFIVQSADLADAVAAVEAAGGRVTHELGIISGVGAVLSRSQLAALDANPAVRAINTWVDQE